MDDPAGCLLVSVAMSTVCLFKTINSCLFVFNTNQNKYFVLY